MSASKVSPASAGSPDKLKKQKSMRTSTSSPEISSKKRAAGNSGIMSPETAANLARANSGRVSADSTPTKLTRGKSGVSSAGHSPVVSRNNSGNLKEIACEEPPKPHVTPLGEFKPKRDEFYTANACCCVVAGCQFVDMKHAYIQLELCCMRQDLCCVGTGNDVCIVGSGADIDSCLAVGLRCCTFACVTPKGICIVEHHCCCCHVMANFCHPEGFHDIPIACSFFGVMIAPLLGCCVKLSDAVEHNGSCCHCL